MKMARAEYPLFSASYREAAILSKMMDFPTSQYPISGFSVTHWEAMKLAHAEYPYFSASYWEAAILNKMTDFPTSQYPISGFSVTH